MQVKFNNLLIKYTIDNEILHNISKIERYIAQIKSSTQTTKNIAETKEKILIENLIALSGVLDLGYDYKKVKMIRLGNLDPSEKSEILIRNIRQVYDFITTNYQNKTYQFDYNLVLHITKLLQTDIMEPWDIARMRDSGVGAEINSLYELSNQHYEDCNCDDFIRELTTLIEQEDDTHPIIKVILVFVIYNFFSPFVGMNFCFSLITLHLLLDKYDYANNFGITVMNLLYKNKEILAYLEEMLSAEEPHYQDITLLLNSFTRSFKEQLELEMSNYDDMDAHKIHELFESISLNERQQKFMKIILTCGEMRRMEYSKIFKVSSMTAYRDLNFLVEKGVIGIKGIGKATKYIRK